MQIAHGMGEHAGRYAPLAAALTTQGYAVYADDHRGHGLSRHAEPGHLGDNGWNRLVSDMVTLSETIREQHPGLSLVLLGHSLGSFAAQQYVLDHAHLIDALALAGTTAVDVMLAPQAQAAAEGGDPLLALNQAFQPSRTPFDWLSRDEPAVDAYLSDPMCGFSLDAQGMADVTIASASLAQPRGMVRSMTRRRRKQRLIRRVLRSAALRTHPRWRDQRLGDLPQPVRHDPARSRRDRPRPRHHGRWP